MHLRRRDYQTCSGMTNIFILNTFTAFRPLIGRCYRALPPSDALCLPYATGSAEKRLPRAAAIGRGGGNQPPPLQPTSSSDHGAVAVLYLRRSGCLTSNREIPPW